MFFTISKSTYFSVHPGLEKPLLNRISPPSTSMTGPWTDILYGCTRVSLSTSFYTDFLSVDLRTLEVECLLRLSLYSSGTIELLKIMYNFSLFLFVLPVNARCPRGQADAPLTEVAADTRLLTAPLLIGPVGLHSRHIS
jgi:hypothetical protein